MIEPPSAAEIHTMMALLSDRSRAESPATFPADRAAADHPGMYAWWADEEACQLLGAALGADLPPLIYIGQAGATRWPSGVRSRATLASRIRSQHIRGNTRSSTFRLTISALLRRPLTLEPDQGGSLIPESNRRVSDWIADHLQVGIAAFSDRDRLRAIEEAAVGRLDPPLNLGRCLPTHARARLTELRRALQYRESPESPVAHQ